MIKKIILFGLLLINCIAIAQQKKVEIDETTTFDTNTPITIIGNRFYQNDIRLANYHLLQVFANNEKAMEMMKKAKKNRTWGQLCIGGGVFLIGTQVTSELVSKKFRWDFFGVGVGLVGVSIPLLSKSKLYTFGAIDQHNTNLEEQKTAATRTKTELSITTSTDGIGLSVRF